MSKAEWHDAKTECPQKEGSYLVCTVFRYGNLDPKPCYYILRFVKNLFAVDDRFYNRENNSGWIDWDSESGYYEIDDVLYWSELPEPPDELKKDEKRDHNS